MSFSPLKSFCKNILSKKEIRCRARLSKKKSKKDITTTKEYKQFRLDVLTRDNFTCSNCGNVGGKLEVHHLKLKSKYPELACVVKNGITLCYECHTKVHGCRWDYLYK